MVMLNDLDRFHLVMDVIDRVPGPARARRRTCASRWSTSACATAPTRASTARTPELRTGPGRARSSRLTSRVGGARGEDGRALTRARAGRQRRLEQPQADAARARRRGRRRGRRDARAADAPARAMDPRRLRQALRAASRRSRTRSGTASCTAASEFTRGRCWSTRGVAAQLRGADRPRAAAPAQVAGGARRRQRGAARRCPRWRASTPPSTRRMPAGRGHLRAAPASGASAGGCAATASTASPTRGSRGARRSCSSATRRRAADRQLPPRRRRLAGRDRRTAPRWTPRWASRRWRAW